MRRKGKAKTFVMQTPEEMGGQDKAERAKGADDAKPLDDAKQLDPALQEVLALADDAITPEAKAEARAWAKRIVDGAEPTTLCTEHVPNEERPLECAKCGKPIASPGDEAMLGLLRKDFGDDAERVMRDAIESEKALFRDKTDDWEERIDAARASEERMPPEVMASININDDDDEWSDIVTPEEREAPLCAVMTPEQLAAALDGEAPLVMTPDELAAALDEKKPLGIRDFPASEYLLPKEGTEPAGYAGMVELSKLWLERADVLSKKRGMGLVPYLEWLIKRDWVASGGRGA